MVTIIIDHELLSSSLYVPNNLAIPYNIDCIILIKSIIKLTITIHIMYMYVCNVYKYSVDIIYIYIYCDDKG